MKRPKSDAAPSGRDRKRAKMRQARFIQVEPEQPQRADNLTASSSALPPNLNVDKFVQARAFELEAIERSMHTAKTAGNTRAFQSLPRHLRRRAASHNVQRLPMRLRYKARLEIMNDKLKHKKRKFRDIPWRKKRKLLHLTKNKILQMRAEKRGWLETHVWHAKRMKMVDKWGHRVAKTPTEKSFRPSYRAAQHGCLLHDASYNAFIEVVGPEDALVNLFKTFADPSTISPSAPRFKSGARVAQTTLYGWYALGEPGWPNRMLAPAQILWRPGGTTQGQHRTVWIIVHPSASDEVEQLFKSTRAARTKDVKVHLLEDRVNMFQLFGPKAGAVLSAALSPVHGLPKEKPAFLEHLASSSLDNLPPGILASMIVHDPRLSFPPKMPGPAAAGATGPPPIPSAQLSSLSDEAWAQYKKKALPTFTKVQLDRRRSEAGVDAKNQLKPTVEDDRLPILIYKHTIGFSGRSSRAAPSYAIDGLTLIVPGNWAMAFLMSLVYCAPRIAGIDQIQQLHHEAGVLAFPFDHPWTEPGKTEITEEADKKQAKWERTPPAKRVNYQRLETVSPFRPRMQYFRQPSGAVEHKVASSWQLTAPLFHKLLKAKDCNAALQAERDLLPGRKSGRGKEKSLEFAFISISVTPVDGGVPQSNAALYEEQRALPSADTSASEFKVDTHAISGWILHGGYSMARGQGFGLGCLGFWAARDLFTDKRDAKSVSILYKNPKSRVAKRARIELLE